MAEKNLMQSFYHILHLRCFECILLMVGSTYKNKLIITNGKQFVTELISIRNNINTRLVLENPEGKEENKYGEKKCFPYYSHIRLKLLSHP